MHRCWIIRPIIVVATVALGACGCGRKAEPVYSGKPVTEWLNAGQEDLCQAVHEIGLPALPFILNKLAREDPQFGANSAYRRAWRNIPATLRRLLPPPGPTNFDEDRACTAILELGPATIPSLIQSLDSPNLAVREVSIDVLGRLGQRGKNIHAALPALTAASRSNRLELANRARWALQFSTHPSHE